MYRTGLDPEVVLRTWHSENRNYCGSLHWHRKVATFSGLSFELMWHLFQVQHANILLKDIFILHLYLVCFLFELLFYFSGHYFFIPSCQFGIPNLSPKHKKGGEEPSADNPLAAIITKYFAYRLNKENKQYKDFCRLFSIKFW